MDTQKKERIEKGLMRWLPWALIGLCVWYLKILYDGLQAGVFWIEGWSIMAHISRFSLATPYISKINMISVSMLCIAVVMIVVWADLHGYLAKMLED